MAANVPSWEPSKLVYVHGTEVLPSFATVQIDREKRWLSLEASMNRVSSPDQWLLPLQRYITAKHKFGIPFYLPLTVEPVSI